MMMLESERLAQSEGGHLSVESSGGGSLQAMVPARRHGVAMPSRVPRIHGFPPATTRVYQTLFMTSVAPSRVFANVREHSHEIEHTLVVTRNADAGSLEIHDADVGHRSSVG